MNKIVLSALAAVTLTSVAANAAALKLYQDENGQVFTQPAEGRTLIKDTTTPVFAKADKLKFSGLTYIGYKYNDYKDGTTSYIDPAEGNLVAYSADTSQFEIRRAYLQVKVYLLEDPKSYYRVTLDTYNDGGSWDMRMKYAYLYLNAILPSTGVEFGLVHRPWHDYEEHSAWYYRNIQKVFIENSNGAHLSNSADLGFNFKTKTKYFDSEIGLFNGEGYHELQTDDNSMSLEWRATAHILGVNGKDKQTKKTYWDASFFGQLNQNHKGVDTNGDDTIDRYDDLYFYGLHTVYNQPSFLVAAQYIQSLDTADNSTYVSAQAGSGYSVNAEYRLGEAKEYRILGRYDSWKPDLIDTDPTDEKEQRTYIAGLAWDQNKNVEWVANVEVTDNESGSARENLNGTAYMLTAEVKF